MCLSKQLPEEAEGGADQMGTDEGYCVRDPSRLSTCSLFHDNPEVF